MREAATSYPSAHVLMVEDDTIPQIGFFTILRNILDERELDCVAYIKLYHPDRLLGYLNPEPHRWLEWAALSSLGVFIYQMASTGGRWKTNFRPQTIFLQIVLVMLLLEVTGRQALLNLLSNLHIHSLVGIYFKLKYNNEVFCSKNSSSNRVEK